MPEGESFIEDRQVGVHRTHKGDWEAVFSVETKGAAIGFQALGSTVHEALRNLADRIEEGEEAQ